MCVLQSTTVTLAKYSLPLLPPMTYISCPMVTTAEPEGMGGSVLTLRSRKEALRMYQLGG